MLSVVVLVLAVFHAAIEVGAIIPVPCATTESLTSRTCCPVPSIPGATQCGANLKRGSCQQITIPESEYSGTESDVRKRWPVQYFNRTCVCNERYGGFDCGECSYGYNDGADCMEKTVRKRRSVGNMNDNDWKEYRTALRAVKDSRARYMVAKTRTSDPQVVYDSLVRPTTYDLFVWIHHFVAKDNEVSTKTGQQM